jgi:hypothetical protein
MVPLYGPRGTGANYAACQNLATGTKALVGNESIGFRQDSNSTLPPMATVLMVSVRSVAKRSR